MTKQKSNTIGLKPLFRSGALNIYSVNSDSELEIPFITNSKISAGFPSPAADFTETAIDFNKHLIKNPSTTFVIEVIGNSMIKAGIFNKSLIIVDKSLEPTNDKIAVCVINGEFTLKRLKVTKQGIFLMPENDDFKPIKISEYEDFEIWGIATFTINPL